MDPNYPVVPIFNFLSVIFILLILTRQLYSWNVGVFMYGVWMATGCFCVFVNTIVWKDNVRDVAIPWCEFVTRVYIGIHVATPACTFTIVRRLYVITSSLCTARSRRDKRRDVLVDLSICLGFPLIIIAAHYVVQGHRYNIVEEIGCVDTTFNTPLAYVLYLSWPIVFGCLCAMYAPFILRKFIQHRKEMDEFLVSGTTMNRERYHRLIALSCVDTVVTLPLGAYVVWVNAVHGPPMQPWIGWAAVHSNFSAAWPFPADVWKSVHWFRVSIYWREWVYVVCTVFYVAFFGFTAEMRRWYIKPFIVIGRFLGLRPSAPAKRNAMSIIFQTVQTSQSMRSDALCVAEEENIDIKVHEESRALEKSGASFLDTEGAPRKSPHQDDLKHVSRARDGIRRLHMANVDLATAMYDKS